MNMTIMEVNTKENILKIIKGEKSIELTLGDLGHLLSSKTFKPFIKLAKEYHKEWR